jgi:hypothetical protein
MGLLKDRAARYAAAVVRFWRQQRRAMRERSSPPFVEAYVTSIALRVPILYLVILFDVALLDVSFHAVAPLAGAWPR